ncbi:MAG: hypothetical protein PHS16_02630 [Candidatus Colwellbacteria bacterium]|jgi:hypothetical protein|nr:hypothetical protein [Candidatus Colwellbacteria bacterium]MDD3752801.1 hypothetical protein [Candidatus Colwellbacteria bacterium]
MQLNALRKNSEEMSEMEKKLAAIITNLNSLIDSPSGYYHPPSGSTMKISKTEKGIKIELPLTGTCFTQIFVIGKNKDEDIDVLWLVKARLYSNDPVTKLIAAGEEAFQKFWDIYQESRIGAIIK